jgi:hypothetical protein
MNPEDRQMSDHHEAEAMSDERRAKLADLLSDLTKAEAALPQAERDRYRRAQQSVVDARRHAERTAHEHWIG